MITVNAHPPVRVTGRHVTITPAINDYVNRKLESLHLDYPKIIEAHVILEVAKYRHAAEVILVCSNHITIEAREQTNDMYAAIDAAVDKICRQMRKYKTRLMKKHRPRHDIVHHLAEHVLESEPVELDEEDGAHHPVVKSERYPVKPMFVDEAVLQLEMSTRQFVVFLNARSSRMNVLYRRKSGEFGLIEPSNGK
ncbi:MAG: Ribosome hibernation promoting factor Hpf [uncultured Chthoniobacterales bacterium]|uniref:Ribosome hibernation promoting factor n=1 Tax=uncultured Chthoniobacterales bacterium TaxID=1836801 RepID=A0A6J4IHV1_9BACT|nr:MAG: Ribosome hibernation promoting factor Hpf [uncultured Chthoniobacterales bacterium]